MIAKSLALVRRSLRVDSRDVRPHLFRCALGAVILFTLTTIQLERFTRTAPGLDLFKWVMYDNYWFITIAGATFFATIVTEEREERTLSLLKLAGVSPPAFILGKWLPKLIGALLLIVIQLPFAILAITLGGVLWQQVGAAYVALLAHLFFVGNLGLLCSVVLQRTSSACGAAVFLLFIFHVFPFVIQSAVNEGLRAGTFPAVLGNYLVDGCDAAIAMCALWKMTEIMSSGFNDPWGSFQVQSNIIAGTVLLGLAWLLFVPFTRNDIEPGESRLANALRHVIRINKERRSWDLALVWKDFHYIGGGPLVILVKCSVYASVVFFFALLVADWRLYRIDHEDLGWSAFIGGWFAIVLELSVLATRVYRTEMTERTWSTLSMLPLSTMEVSYTKLVGALVAIIPAIGCLFSAVLLIPEEVGEIIEDLFRRAGNFLGFSYFCLQVLLGVHLATYLSVVSRWAVWPLAIFMGGFIIVMLNMMVVSCLSAMMIGGGDEEAILFLMCCGSFVGTVFVHVLIGQRLVAMRAE